MQDHTEQYSSNSSGFNATGLSSTNSSALGGSREVDFATLVGSGKDSGAGVARDAPSGQASTASSTFDPFAFDELPSKRGAASSSNTPSLTPSHTGNACVLPAATRPGLMPVRSNSANVSSSGSGSFSGKPLLPAPPTKQAFSSMSRPSSSLSSHSLAPIAKPAAPLPPPGWSSGSTLVPSSSMSTMGMASGCNPSAASPEGSGPNYNISLPPAENFGMSSQVSVDVMSSMSLTSGGFPHLHPQKSSLPPMLTGSSLGQNSAIVSPNVKMPSQTPPGWAGGSTDLLQPTRKPSSGTNSNTAANAANWNEFDPFA